MDRTELIARLRSEANAMESGLNARLSRDAQFVRCREADTMREAADALESRPAPTEERILAAAKAAWRADMIDAADQRGHPIHDGFDFEWGWKDLANMPLSGPGFVRQWNTIAKAVLATDTTPSRDEEGSVDREAALEEAAQICEADHRSEVAKDCGYSPSWHAYGKKLAARIRALKTSTPETQTVEGGDALTAQNDHETRRNPPQKGGALEPERAKTLEEAARVDHELLKRVEDVAAAVGRDRHWIAASLTGHDWRRIAAAIRALSASPTEVADATQPGQE